MMKANPNNFKKLVGQNPSDLKEKLEWEQANRGWLRKSAYIAVNVLAALEEKRMTQKALADQMGVTPQYVNKLVKGSENLSLETIDKLEKALEIVLLPLDKTGNRRSVILHKP